MLCNSYVQYVVVFANFLLKLYLDLAHSRIHSNSVLVEAHKDQIGVNKENMRHVQCPIPRLTITKEAVG